MQPQVGHNMDPVAVLVPGHACVGVRESQQRAGHLSHAAGRQFRPDFHPRRRSAFPCRGIAWIRQSPRRLAILSRLLPIPPLGADFGTRYFPEPQ